MVIDHFEEFAEISRDSLRERRREAEALTKTVCDKEQEFGKRKFLDKTPRCDAMMWLTDLMKIDVLAEEKVKKMFNREGSINKENNELKKLGKLFDDTRKALNEAIRMQDGGDETLLVDT